MLQRVALVLTLLFAGAAYAQQGETILSFHSDIDVHADGSMTVRESIRVIALGQEIQRGIYRDFPTKYKDRYGNRVQVGFDIQDVKRDGAPEQYHTDRLRNGVRVYFGRSDVFLPQGEHTYEFTYRTTQQLGYFDDHDELYWNVTGNAWGLPILRASADVTLPEGVAEADIAVEGYTGPQGAQGQDYIAEVEGPGHASFYTTRPLAPKEGLTIVVSFPKGLVAEPNLADKTRAMVRGNLGLILTLGGFVLVLGYYTAAWLLVGVDPARGRVLPRETPPEGYSAAALRYIRNMGADGKVFSVSLISMAIKRYLRIEEADKRDYTIIRNEDARDEDLNDEERAVADKLFELSDSVILDKANHQRIGGAQSALRTVLSKKYRGEYFNWHALHVFGGVLLSIAVIGGTIIATQAQLGVLFFVSCILLFGMAILFAFLLRAPTRKGRRLLDEAEGFQMYLNGDGTARFSAQTNQDELNRRFETYLPYAIALDTQSEWANAFTAALASTEPARRHSYVPLWYHGTRWQTVGATGFADSLSSSFSSVVTSSSSPPGSSSGSSGGGFSGGGGGGGGGGGW